MVKTIRVSEEFHALLKAHTRAGETMEDALRRLVGGPAPEVLAELIGTDPETAREIRKSLEARRDGGRARRAAIRDRSE